MIRSPRIRDLLDARQVMEMKRFASEVETGAIKAHFEALKQNRIDAAAFAELGLNDHPMDAAGLDLTNPWSWCARLASVVADAQEAQVETWRIQRRERWVYAGAGFLFGLLAALAAFTIRSTS